MTQHEKMGLMCTYNLTTFWSSKLYNFLCEHRSLTQFSLFMQRLLGISCSLYRFENFIQ